MDQVESREVLVVQQIPVYLSRVPTWEALPGVDLRGRTEPTAP